MRIGRSRKSCSVLRRVRPQHATPLARTRAGRGARWAGRRLLRREAREPPLRQAAGCGRATNAPGSEVDTTRDAATGGAAPPAAPRLRGLRRRRQASRPRCHQSCHQQLAVGRGARRGSRARSELGAKVVNGPFLEAAGVKDWVGRKRERQGWSVNSQDRQPRSSSRRFSRGAARSCERRARSDTSSIPLASSPRHRARAG